MIHTHVKTLQDFANDKTAPDGSRKYFTETGAAYPSVTTVLGYQTRDSILQWRKRVGAEEADRISRQASTRGTKIHEMCEKKLDNEAVNHGNMSLIDVQMWRSFQPILERIDNIHAQEIALYSDHLRLAGRVDCIGEFDGKLSVIDFKTSRKPKKEEWITNYFSQAAAYSIMYEERTGIAINRSVILIAVEEEDPQVFIARRDKYVPNLLHARDLYECDHR
jgi:genome maintenance exonuclease 1|tara:strand:- start:221 stop:883 length:663 start_codon:yes stop_codon:yes gene_type:complete